MSSPLAKKDRTIYIREAFTISEIWSHSKVNWGLEATSGILMTPKLSVASILCLHIYYSGELHTYGTNLKWIWILNSLYVKICVNKNSHRFVIIKLQNLFGTSRASRNTLKGMFCPFCLSFLIKFMQPLCK